MNRVLGITIVGLGLLAASGRPALAVPPGPGQHFDCSDGGDTSCALDDQGCVSNTKGHLKCSEKISKVLTKVVYMVTICHEKQVKSRLKGVSDVDAGAAEELCEAHARTTLDRTLEKLQNSGTCDPIQLSNAAASESTLLDPGPDSLDAHNADYYCDATSGNPIGDDDAGFVPVDAAALKCAASVARNVAKLILAAGKCHEKMNGYFFKGKNFDETACEENDPVKHKAAIDKYGKVRDKLVASAICPPCLDYAAQNDLANAALEGGDAQLLGTFPCSLGP
jgi:hypothetical protein